MEQHPNQGGDFQATLIADEPTPTPEHQNHLTDEQLIHYQITEALRQDRPIDHATARCIAAQLHGGQASALYALASSGALVDGLTTELDSWRTNETPVEVEPWLDALDEYLDSREDHSPVEGWHQLWPARSEREDDEPATGEDERPPYGPPSSAIGPAVVGVQVEHQGEDVRLASQEAGQQAAESPAVQRIRDGLAAAGCEGREIDDHTARDIARQFKAESAGALAVFAACGAILNDNDQLFRELYAGWQEHTEEQQAWVEALRSYCLGRDSEGPVSYWCDDGECRDIASGDRPEIWVGSLSDYNHGYLHGMWIAADQEPEEIQEQIAWILRTSPSARRYGDIAEEWGIFDHSGFYGYQVSEWSSLDTVSLVAKGIAEHGPAYAEWVEYIGDTAGELLDDERFRDHYEGTFDSLEDYVEYILEETGFYSELDRALEFIPEDLRLECSRFY